MPLKDEAADLLMRMSRAKARRGDVGRARAYAAAALAIRTTEDFERYVAEGRIREIRGVGASIADDLLAFAESGRLPDWLERNPTAGDLVLPTVPSEAAVTPFPGLPDLHVHTTWSDGSLSVEEVVRVARHLGATSVGISDHSGSLKIARGLSPAEVLEQWDEIDRVRAANPDFTILRGTECDILKDGRLDHPDAILEGFDYVIGSLHSSLKLPLKEQTARVLRALENPHLDILGHPTTRVPGYRPPAQMDLDRVFAKAAERNVALEVNGSLGRQDLEPALAARALEAGAKLSIGSDAHDADEMLAFLVARANAAAAGATEADLFNSQLRR